MDSKKTAQQIVKLSGGASNFEHIEHCSTRLWLSLNDKKLVEQPQLKKVPGVIGVNVNGQCQIVIDKELSNVCDAIEGLVEGKQTAGDKAHTKKKWGAVIVDFLISVFQPLIPAIAGGGVLKLLLIILDMVGWLSKGASTYKVLDRIGTALIYFLPLLVAITTATKLKINFLLAVPAGIHKPLLSNAVAAMGQFGRVALYLPASLAHNIAEAGACSAILIKRKDNSMKSAALSSALSAQCGITERALYGITLLNKKVLFFVMIGSVIGGSFLSYMVVAAFSLTGPGLASISIFAAPDNPNRLKLTFIGAMLSSAILLLWRDKAKEVSVQVANPH